MREDDGARINEDAGLWMRAEPGAVGQRAGTTGWDNETSNSILQQLTQLDWSTAAT